VNPQADSITQDEHNNIIQDLTERHKVELSEFSNQLIKEMEDKYENDMNEIKQEIECINMEYNTDIQN